MPMDRSTTEAAQASQAAVPGGYIFDLKPAETGDPVQVSDAQPPISQEKQAWFDRASDPR
jgi:hypothetical protein